MKVVLDSSVVVAAARSRRGASARLLELLVDRRFSVVLSTALLLEYEEVLQRERPPGGWSEGEVTEFLDSICAVTEHYDFPLRLRPLLCDPDDEFVVELALAGAVDFIVTHNVKDFEGSESVGVHVITPGQFLKLLEGRP